jgi:hypothetical protein
MMPTAPQATTAPSTRKTTTGMAFAADLHAWMLGEHESSFQAFFVVSCLYVSI